MSAVTEHTRVYIDMVGDLFHRGHVALLRAARALGDHLVVGVLSDESAEAYKRVPIMTLDERVAVIGSCRYVDELVPDAPHGLTEAWLSEHGPLAGRARRRPGRHDAAAQVYGPAVASGTAATRAPARWASRPRT